MLQGVFIYLDIQILVMEAAIVVLAGGLSTRMGTNKLNVQFKGMPMLRYTVYRLKQLNLPIYISVHDKYLEGFKNCIKDTHSSPRTPLLGILSVCTKIKHEKIFVTTADSPEIDLDVIRYMLNYLPTFSSVIPMWESGKPEIIHAAYDRQKLTPILKMMWNKNLYQVSSLLSFAPKPLFISTEHLRHLDPQLKSLMDFDTPEEIHNYFNKN